MPLVRLGAWFGLATGFGELALLAVQEFVLDRYLYYIGRDTIWMIPVADVLIFTTIGLLLAAVRRFLPVRVPDRAAVFSLAFPGFVALAYFVDDKIHDVALLLLSAGLAVQVARLASARPAAFRRLARWSTPIMLATIAAGTVLVAWRVARHERAGLEALGEPPPGAPNVLLIVWDTVRAHDLSAYGYERLTTPALARLARDGVLFEHALSTASWTLPSHAGMFTGHLPQDLSVRYTTPLDDAEPTLAEALAGAGWATGGFVANFGAAGWESGLGRGFTRYEDFPRSWGQLFVGARLVRTLFKIDAFRDLIGFHDVLGRKGAPSVTRDFLAWRDAREGRPYFAFLNYYDAHGPYLPPEPYATEFAEGKAPDSDPLIIERMNAPGRWTPEAIQAEVDAYDGAIHYLDDELARLFEELEARGDLANTLVILTSDHGEEFGEHAMLGHGDFLWPTLLRVPLVISLPGRVPAGVRVGSAVSLTRIPATVVALVGAGDPEAWPGGGSLEPAWAEDTGSARSPEPVISQEEGVVSLAADFLQYVRDAAGREWLFDLEADPRGLRDLSGTAESAARLEEIRERLAASELEARGAAPEPPRP